MKKEATPQDDEKLLEGKMTKLLYVTDENGKYAGANSKGWEAENVVLQQAWEEINERVSMVREQVKQGERSPIAYFMEKNLMNYQILAGHAGTLQLMVWLHCKPFFFRLLGKRMLQRYADAFQITVDELTDLSKL